MNYDGLKCPICGKPFTPDDDIVVCPQCGAPYHRACYAKEGKCVYADRHGTPNAWKSPAAERQQQDEIVRCPQCGTANPKSALYCAHCGTPLTQETPETDNPFPRQNPNYRNFGAGQPGEGGGVPPTDQNVPPDYGYEEVPFFGDPLGGVNPAEPVSGVPAGDLAKFVQENTQYYIPIFVNTDHFGRSRFNFSAFLFQGVWMLFRKLYKVGAVVSAIQGVLLFSYLFLMKYAVLPLYEKLYALAGITKGVYGYSITAEQREKMVTQLMALSSQQQFIAALPALYFFLTLVLMIACGIVANRIYMKDSIQKVTAIHSETSSPEDFSARLQREGGVNAPLAAMIAGCFILIHFFALL